MHGRRGNYMPCKWKRKKGGCHGQPSRGVERLNTLPRTTHVRRRMWIRSFSRWLFSFLRISRPTVPSTRFSPPLLLLLLLLFLAPPRVTLRAYTLLPSPYLSSFLFLFFPPPPRVQEKARTERTDGVNPWAREKQKADRRRPRRLLSFTGLWRLRQQKEDRPGGASATDC